MQTTANYGLKKPEQTDVVNIDDLNGNADITDTELAKRALKTDVPTKVSQLTNDSEFITSVPVQSVNGKTGAVSLAASDVGAVPTTREVNGKELSSNISLTCSDLGAEPIISTKNSAFNQSFETSTSNIKMDGTVSVGNSSNIARADHVHPSDTSKVNQTDFNSHLADNTRHITAAERTAWNNKPSFTVADITYYVNASTGSDSNNGSSSGTPFKTIQHAINTLPQIINNTIIINVANGTYAEELNIAGHIGMGALVIQGNTSNPSNCIVNGAFFYANRVAINFMGFTLSTTTQDSIDIEICSNLNVSNCIATADGKTNDKVGIYVSYSSVTISSCQISNRVNGIRAGECSNVFSSTNSGSDNSIGLQAYASSHIGCYMSQPLGTINEACYSGSTITHNYNVVEKTINDTTYYVSTTGSDTNDGSSGAPFRTIQHVIDILPQVIDNTVVISIAPGTYPEDITINGFIGKGGILLAGSEANPSSVSVQKIYVMNSSCEICMDGITLTSTSDDTIHTFNSRRVFVSHIVSTSNTIGTNNYGIFAINSSMQIVSSVISNKSKAIEATVNSHFATENCSGSGNDTVLVSSASHIYVGGTVPTGTTAQLTMNGGVIS